MTDIDQWRRKTQPTQDNPHLSVSDRDETAGEANVGPATRKKLRPKLSSYFSHYMPNAALVKPVSPSHENYTTQAGRPSVSLSTHWLAEACNPEPEQLMDSIMKGLLAEPYHALDPTHNSSLLMIFEAYRALRDQNELLTGKLQNEVSCRVAAELETDRAEQGWRVDKERYKKEIKRLELIIAKGRMGLAEVTRARQDSMLKRTHEGIQADHVEDRKETVFEFLERTRAEDEDAMQTHRAVFHSRPVSPSQRMAALSHEISATTFQKYIPRNLRSDTEVTTLSRASIYDELFSADPKIDRFPMQSSQRCGQSFSHSPATSATFSSLGDALPDEIDDESNDLVRPRQPGV